MSDDKNNAPTFSLSQSERELLIFIRRHLDAVFSAQLSAVASGRMGYRVTENTQFTLSQDFTTIQITERADQPPESADNSGGVRTAE